MHSFNKSLPLARCNLYAGNRREGSHFVRSLTPAHLEDETGMLEKTPMTLFFTGGVFTDGVVHNTESTYLSLTVETQERQPG